MRHLAYALPSEEPCKMVLVEDDGTDIVAYLCNRSFRKIEREGRMFRLNGHDRTTGELVYVAEVV